MVVSLDEVREVEVQAPSRLHFGLLSPRAAGARQFGGVGAMIDLPGVSVRIRPAPSFQLFGEHHQRAYDIVKRFLASEQLELPSCRIEILNAAPQHVGLGTGTQLALALASGVVAFMGEGPTDPAELAAATGRGLRSSIGCYGFFNGGLLLDVGKEPGDALAELGDRVALPEDWRWLLIRPQAKEGVSGILEKQAFAQLPVVPQSVSGDLETLVREQMFPAARCADFEAFSESLYRYGVAAGECFASQQAGSFATEQIAELVTRCRSEGLSGVGQSSWGPTLFVLFENQREANAFGQEIARWPSPDALCCTIAAPNNNGASISVHKSN